MQKVWALQSKLPTFQKISWKCQEERNDGQEVTNIYLMVHEKEVNFEYKLDFAFKKLQDAF